MNKNNVLLFLAIIIFGLVITEQGHRIEKALAHQETILASLEGRIALHEGKATLTNGDVCIIHGEGLEDPDLAYQLVNACMTAKQMRDAGEFEE